MALLNPCLKFKYFLAKSILLKYYENGDKKIFLEHVPGSDKSRIYAGKSTKRGFSLMSNDEKKFQPIFQILHIKSAWFLQELAMALVTTIRLRFLQVCGSLGAAHNPRNSKLLHKCNLPFLIPLDNTLA